jgi:D-alanyl-lipoteichoic acid acyltransferase DltB (MBOAT superfamily)
MLFNSLAFLIFLPVVFFLYWFFFNQSLSKQNAFLLVASYFFYGWWSYAFMGLLALSTLLDYLYGFGVASSNPKKAKCFLWLSLINNLGILAVFKYYNFFATQFTHAFKLIGVSIHPVLLNVALPIGISFYTFHGMSYVFDIYRKKQAPITNFVDYAVFVSFFPLLVAGPIERANHLLPQVQKARFFSNRQAIDGLRLMLWGMFKKVVIADNLAVIADKAFNHYTELNGAALIVGAIAFSFQIYGDFSGYSDIALGTAKLFGFELLSNFKFPYFSRDIAEFWRRWHVSLSSWFRDYLYIPLGGSKHGKSKAVRNTFIIFLVSGFWHGASWNFVIWGFLHACAFLPLLLLNRNRIHLTEIVAENRSLPTLQELGQMASTFIFVTAAWVFFRAHGLDHSFGYFRQIVQSIYKAPSQFYFAPEGRVAFIYIIPLLLGDWGLRKDERHLKKPPMAWIVYSILLYFIAYNLLAKDESSSFIYFQF